MIEPTCRCRICGELIAPKFYKVRETLYGTGDPFDYFECPICGTLQISEYPLDVSAYYPTNYWETGGYSHSIKRIKAKLIEQRNLYELGKLSVVGFFVSFYLPSVVLKHIKKYIKNNNPISILDVGCGNGAMLRALRTLGRVNLTGLDEFCPNKNVEGLTFLNCSFLSVQGQYDLIIFSHSLEHMPDQNSIFKKIYNLLTDNGACIVAIPIFPNYIWNKYGVNWVQIDAPRHFYLHSVESINHLAKSHGLIVESVDYNSYEYQFYGTFNAIDNVSSKLTRKFYNVIGGMLYKYLTFVYYRIFSFCLNRKHIGDQAVFVIRRLQTP